MPELPEVETICRGLHPYLTGAYIKAVDFSAKQLRWPYPKNITQRLTGARIQSVYRRAKYILCDLTGGETLMLHLGMSGRVQFCAAKDEYSNQDKSPFDSKHTHAVFTLSNGALLFNDPRRFGAIDICATHCLTNHPRLRGLGPEPLSNAFHAASLYERLQKRKHIAIKAALLDQRLIAGIGNIYASEALFRAKIHPARKAATIAQGRIARLVQEIRATLTDAIKAGGSSLRDYRQSDGTLGYFQHAFKVYGKDGAPCPTDGCTRKIRKIIQGGRSGFYCPGCQR